MDVTKLNSGRMEVKYISAHSNHTPDPNEAGFLPLLVSIKEDVAMMLILGISVERIMDGMLNIGIKISIKGLVLLNEAQLHRQK